MELADILRWAVPIVGGAVALWLTQRNLSRIDNKGLEKLARFGLHPVAESSQGGTTVAGQYRGFECGYHWGTTAKLINHVQTRAGGFSAGSEFFVKIGVDGPALAIVQRDDKAWQRFVGGVVPSAEVLTGDSAFDQRFSVRCSDPELARSVLDPNTRAALLDFPLILLIRCGDQVIFPLHFDGKRLFTALGVPMSVGWGLMDHAPTFLDAAIVLARAIQAARRS